MYTQKLQAMKEKRRAAIKASPLFEQSRSFDRAALETVFSQYWYPLAYFPEFLAQTLCVLPNLEDKSAIARVLSEELGDGKLEDAHEVAYFQALQLLGIPESRIKSFGMLPATQRLMEGYRSCRGDLLRSLGYFLSTEVADLWIVSNLGKIMLGGLEKRQPIAWIDLHVKQEPGHVEDATRCFAAAGDAGAIDRILEHADECSRLWDEFFVGIHESIELAHAAGLALSAPAARAETQAAAVG